MRSPVDAGFRLLVLALGLTVAGCGVLGGDSEVASLSGVSVATSVGGGPAADYPMVLGEPFTVDGELYTPADTLNYDAVGLAGLDDGSGVTAAHRTLPLPSYAEVTSLESGKTILVRIERRGPMTGNNLLALSSGAAVQLGASEGAAVRVRRVNPPEAERAELRAGRTAPERIETPKSLVEVLRRKLPPSGATTLRPAVPQQTVAAATPVGERATGLAPAAKAVASTQPSTVKAYPLPSLTPAAVTTRLPVVVTTAEPAKPVAAPAPTANVSKSTASTFVIQAAAFASRANADRAAKALGGFVTPAGTLFRVRTGPFATRGQAEGALAKVRAAGYSDARITTTG